MFDRDRWQEILNVLWMNKLRTFITGVSVAWAIFMLVFLMGGGNGLQNGVNHMFRDDAVNSIWIWSSATSIPHDGLPVGREIKMENADYEKIKTFDGVRHSSGRYNVWGEFSIKHENNKGVFSIRAVHHGHRYLENTEMTHGRYISSDDNKNRTKVAVIGKLVSEHFFDSHEEALGEWINIKGAFFQVIGVFEDTGGDREMSMVYLPVKTGQLAFNGKNRLHTMMLELDHGDVERSKNLEEKVRSEFARKYNFDPKDKKAISTNNGLENYQRFDRLFVGIKFIILLTGLMTLLAGIIAVSNIMLITVKERTKEIGVKKALGATPRHIIGTIIQESIFITVIAGYLGLVFGTALLFGINRLLSSLPEALPFFRNPEIGWQMAVFSLIVLVIAGALGGLIPAYKAARISPVEAMNS